MASYWYSKSDDTLFNGCGLRCTRTAQFISLCLDNKTKFHKSCKLKGRKSLSSLVHAALKR